MHTRRCYKILDFHNSLVKAIDWSHYHHPAQPHRGGNCKICIAVSVITILLQIKLRTTKNTNFDQLCLDFPTSDSSSVYDGNSTDKKYNTFLTIWDQHIDTHCPMKTITFKQREYPWLTENDETMQLKARRNSARREKYRSGTTETATAYTTLKKEFESVLRVAKSRFFDTNPSETSKERWGKIRSFAISNGKPVYGQYDTWCNNSQ